MMDVNCIWVHAHMGDHLDRTLGARDRVAMKAHLSVCDACHEAVVMTRALTSELSDMDDLALPVGFSQRLSARLHQEAERMQRQDRVPHGTPPRKAWWARLIPALPVRPLVGVAATVMLVAGVLLMQGGAGLAPIAGGQVASSTGASAPSALPVSMAMGGDAVVRIWFESEQAVEHVRFSLQLPPGVRMVSGGRVIDSATLTWEGKLQRGRNLIPLQVRGVANGDWTVTASVEKGGTRRAKSIDLRVSGI